MTVELPVNITNPLHDEIMKYQFTKPRYKLKFPGLAGKVCIANFKQNELSFCDACLSQQDEKHPNEDQQRLCSWT